MLIISLLHWPWERHQSMCNSEFLDRYSLTEDLFEGSDPDELYENEWSSFHRNYLQTKGHSVTVPNYSESFYFDWWSLVVMDVRRVRHYLEASSHRRWLKFVENDLLLMKDEQNWVMWQTFSLTTLFDSNLVHTMVKQKLELLELLKRLFLVQTNPNDQLQWDLTIVNEQIERKRKRIIVTRNLHIRWDEPILFIDTDKLGRLVIDESLIMSWKSSWFCRCCCMIAIGKLINRSFYIEKFIFSFVYHDNTSIVHRRSLASRIQQVHRSIQFNRILDNEGNEPATFSFSSFSKGFLFIQRRSKSSSSSQCAVFVRYIWIFISFFNRKHLTLKFFIETKM